MKKKSASSLKRVWSSADPRIFFVALIVVMASTLMLVFQSYGGEYHGPDDDPKTEEQAKTDCFLLEEEKRDDGWYHVVSKKESCSIESFTVMVYLPSGRERITETIVGPKTAILAQKEDLWIRVMYIAEDGSVVNKAKKLQ